MRTIAAAHVFAALGLFCAGFFLLGLATLLSAFAWDLVAEALD